MTPFHEDDIDEEQNELTETNANGFQNLSFACPVDHEGTNVYVKGWRIQNSPKAPIIIVHDLGENVGHFRALAMALREKKHSVYAFDLRGHGRSGRRLGHISNFKQLVNDLLQICAWVRHQEQGRAPIVLGKGVGALIATYFQSTYPRYGTSLILLTPSIAVTTPVSSIKRFILKTLADIMPTLRIPRALCPQISQDIFSERGPIAITANFANELLRALRRGPKQFAKISCPTLVIGSKNSPLFQNQNFNSLIERSPNKNYFEVVGLERNEMSINIAKPVDDKYTNYGSLETIVETMDRWMNRMENDDDVSAGTADTAISQTPNPLVARS